jgi:hypothetical protein
VETSENILMEVIGMSTIVQAAHRKFFVERRGNIVFVAAETMHGTVASQLVVHEAMKSTGLNFSKTWANIENDGNELVLAVGYNLPILHREQCMDKLIRTLQAFE